MSNGGSGAIWRKNPALAWREIEEETVIISPADSVMHELNDTGSFLWKNIDGRQSSSELAELLMQNFDVSGEMAEADTRALLEELASRRLVIPAEGEVL